MCLFESVWEPFYVIQMFFPHPSLFTHPSDSIPFSSPPNHRIQSSITTTPSHTLLVVRVKREAVWTRNTISFIDVIIYSAFNWSSSVIWNIVCVYSNLKHKQHIKRSLRLPLHSQVVKLLIFNHISRIVYCTYCTYRHTSSQTLFEKFPSIKFKAVFWSFSISISFYYIIIYIYSNLLNTQNSKTKTNKKNHSFFFYKSKPLMEWPLNLHSLHIGYRLPCRLDLHAPSILIVTISVRMVQTILDPFFSDHWSR